jgi:hypothetical protein
MIEHYAQTMHNQKMTTYYAEADSSRLAAQRNRPGMRERISHLLGGAVRPQPTASKTRGPQALRPQHISRVG